MNLSPFALTRALFMLTVVVLVIFGLGSLMRIPATPERSLLYSFYAVAMFGDAFLMGLCLWQLPKHTRVVFWLAVLVLAFNIFPTIFDQFGLADLLFVLLNAATLTSLLLARKEFSPA
jgi:hypothetical protein